MNLPSPFCDRIDFFVDRRRVLIWISIVMLLAAVFIAALATFDILSSTDSRVAASIVLTGILMLTGKASALCFTLLRWSGAVVTVDAQGITDRRLSAEPISWDQITDIRLLDDWGYQIALDIDAAQTAEDAPRSLPVLRQQRQRFSGNPVVQTYFLRTRSRDRLLEFMLPMTAMAPIDFSVVVPTQDVLNADRTVGRANRSALASFVFFAAIVPAVAATYLAWR